jgi:short-subunit dehydrogenase
VNDAGSQGEPPRPAGAAAAGADVVLVTGATGGIGAAVAERLAADGQRLVLTGRSSARLQALALRLEQQGAASHGIAADLLDPAAPARLVDEAVRWGGGLGGLVCCAGGARFTFLERFCGDELEEALRLNVISVAALVRRALPHLVRRPRSHVVIVSSLAVAEPPGLERGTAYLPSKAAAAHFAAALLEEVRDRGVGVTTILPGLTDTAMVPDRLGFDRRTLIAPRSVADAVSFALRAGPDVCVTQIHLKPQRHFHRT